MTSIIVRTSAKCPTCGQDGHIDHVATGANAAKWRRAANVSQINLAEKGMGIKQSFYSTLEMGQGRWTPELISKFESSMMPILNQKKVDVRTL